MVVQQILFFLLAAGAVYLFSKRILQVRKSILQGREENYNDHPEQRWKNVLLLALGQKKMFQKPLVALMHFVIYAGFIIINIEVLEIALDGLLGTHRLFAKPLGGFYPVLINSFELLALGVILVCVAFLARRNVLSVSNGYNRHLEKREVCEDV